MNAQTAHLKPSELETLKRSLEQKRDELRGKALEHLASANDSDGSVAEEIDQANREFEVGDRLSMVRRESDLLQEVEAALERFSDGTYGISEESGDPIPFGRLEAVPWARRNASEEEELERVARDFR